MELTGLQIFKHLPGGQKTEHANCKQCKQPTCMAYALKLAKQQVKIEDCPHFPEDLKAMFLDSIKKQQNEITFGIQNQTKTGGETVMFRHEKTFVNKTVVAIELDCDDKDFDKKYERIKSYKIERVGEEFRVETIYLSGRKNLEEIAERLSKDGFSLIIQTQDVESVEKLSPLNPIFDTDSTLPKSVNCVVSGKNIGQIGEKTENKLKDGYKNLILELDAQNKPCAELLEELTYMRRLAIQNRDERFAYPVMVKLTNSNDLTTLAEASMLSCRYANIIVLKRFDEALLTCIFTLSQNIFTDPQKPLQVEPKIYEFGEPDENAIVMMTTNFALTYFAVANEIEAMNRPVYLIVTASDGMSVLTAWSADKFTSELAAKTIRESNLANKVKTRKIIIPGLLAHMKDELEEEIPDWEFVVGPVEAFQLPEFVKNNF